MDRYNISLVGSAKSQLDELFSRAKAAGKQAEFVQRFGELGRAIVDPQWAFQVGRLVGQTNQPPGGFYREWQYHFLYVKYAIFPDEGKGWVYHIEFNPPSWA